MRSSDRIIVHGQAHKQYVAAKGISSRKIRVISLGALSHFASLRQEDVETQRGNILFFGRILPYKGIEYLIQAGKLIERQFPEVTITIAGDGSFGKYERMVKGDDHFIVRNTFIPDEEVAQFFQKASLVVLPYTDGSQSGVVSIAGAFKKPVVVTDVGNFSEMVEDGKTGFIVPPKDTNALAEAIIKLLKDDKLRQEMGENASRIVMGKFSWDNIAQKTIEVYREAIEAWHKV